MHIKDKKLKRKQVIQILNQYPQLRAAIKSSGRLSEHVSDPEETVRRLEEKKLKVALIEQILDSLYPEEKKLIEMKYLNNVNPQISQFMWN